MTTDYKQVIGGGFEDRLAKLKRFEQHERQRPVVRITVWDGQQLQIGVGLDLTNIKRIFPEESVGQYRPIGDDIDQKDDRGTPQCEPQVAVGQLETAARKVDLSQGEASHRGLRCQAVASII